MLIVCLFGCRNSYGHLHFFVNAFCYVHLICRYVHLVFAANVASSEVFLLPEMHWIFYFAAMQDVSWLSKYRFAAKRLRSIADELGVPKRAIIEKHSVFRSLLNVSPFNVPNELIDFIAVNTDHQLREFNYRNKRIVFTKDMVKKVFNLRSGNKPVVLLGKSDQSDLRDYYKGGLVRLPIINAQTMLKNFPVEDEDAIIRTWDLLCVATVLNPGSANMMCLEYIGGMGDPKKTADYAWDDHILDVVMKHVKKIQKKKLQPLSMEEGAKHDFWISGPMPLLAVSLSFELHCFATHIFCHVFVALCFQVGDLHVFFSGCGRLSIWITWISHPTST